MSDTSEGPNIKVRFAPSPTGKLHLGGGRTALFNWLFARQKGGEFILRIEDTDKERSKKEYEAEILDAIRWLGLDWDKGISKEAKDGVNYRQSERLPLYRASLEKLISEKQAYWCYCPKEDLDAERQVAEADGRAFKYSGRCRSLTAAPEGKNPQVIRIKTPAKVIAFKDLIRGEVKFDTELLDDFVIAKSLEEPLYNFAVVVDDHDMAITHVIRGEEHLSNTPRQIMIQQALGLSEVIYAHLPLVLNAQRAKLSKREADVSLLSYRDKGYLPQAMANFLILMGWHPPHDKEVFTLEELTREFEMERVQKAGAVFNEEKLDWLNREHMKKLTDEELDSALLPFMSERTKNAPPDVRRGAIAAVRERMHTLAEFEELASFFFELPNYEPGILIWKKGTREEALTVFGELETFFRGITSYTAETLPGSLSALTDKYGKGNVLWPLRVALSGQEASPDPFAIAAILGKEEVLRRLAAATQKLSS